MRPWRLALAIAVVWLGILAWIASRTCKGGPAAAACGGAATSVPTPAPAPAVTASGSYEVPYEAGWYGGGEPGNPPSLEERTSGGTPKPR